MELQHKLRPDTFTPSHLHTTERHPCFFLCRTSTPTASSCSSARPRPSGTSCGASSYPCWSVCMGGARRGGLPRWCRASSATCSCCTARGASTPSRTCGGGHPYDEHAATAENGVVALLSIGEGWHNWHHAFPHDYAASELGVSAQFNPTKLFIDLMARLGQVWGRKRADTMWERRKEGRVKVREPTLYTPYNPIYTTTVYDVGHAVCY